MIRMIEFKRFEDAYMELREHYIKDLDMDAYAASDLAYKEARKMYERA